VRSLKPGMPEHGLSRATVITALTLTGSIERRQLKQPAPVGSW